MRAFPLTVLAAEKPVYEGECLSLVFPTVDGQFGILAGHSDIVAAVVPGELRFTMPDGGEFLAAVSEGIVKAEKGRVLILVDTAERPEEIDEGMALQSVEDARAVIMRGSSDLRYHAALAKMARAVSRLRVKNHSKR